MTTVKIDLDECPLDSCDAPVARAFITNEGTKLTTQNLVQARTCLLPTSHDDGAASYIVFHETLETDGDEVDAESAAEPPREDETSSEGSAGSDDGSEPADTALPALSDVDLDGDSLTVYEHIRTATISADSIQLGTLRGKCLDAEIPPGNVDGIADALCKQGYVEEVNDAVYRAVKA